MPDTLRFDFGWIGPPGDPMRRLDYCEDGEYLEASAVADVLREALKEFRSTEWIAHKLDIRMPIEPPAPSEPKE